MNSEILRQRIESITDYDTFVDVELELGTVGEVDLFDVLFAEATSGSSDGGYAARLLIAIDPAPTRDCEALLDEVAKSKWDVSTKEVPFYFISWFGKAGLINSFKQYMTRAELTPMQKQRVETIIYWASGPTSSLVRYFHDWPWMEEKDWG